MYTYITNRFELKSASAEGFFSGYASNYELDSHREIIEKGAFQKNLTEMAGEGLAPKMLWQHDPAQLIGRWEKVIEDGHGLYVEGRLFLEIPKAKEAHILLKEKAVDGLSIGFEVVKSKRLESCRVLQEIKLHEISLVTFPANRQARVHQVKQLEQWDQLKIAMEKLGKVLREGPIN